MPNIFPPIYPQRTAMVQPDQASILGTVGAPSGASLALNSADNAVQAAQDKLAGDAPKKYDYGAHGVLGNIGHVLARTANIAGDILDPAATSLIPNSDLYNAHKRAGDLEEVDKATERQLAAQRESDTVANESANRDQKGEINQAKQETDTAKTNAQLAQHGFKLDPVKGITALSYEEMSPTQQAVHDLKGAQEEQAQATANLRTMQADPNSPQYKLQLARLREAQRAHSIAAQRLGLSEKQFEMRAHGTENGVALPGAMLDDEGGPVGTAFQQNVRPTGVERNKADLANSAATQIEDMKSIVQKHPDFFGPGYGQSTAFKNWVGSGDPDAKRFIAARTIASDHLAGTFGGRSEYALKALDDALGQFKENPQAALAGLDQLSGANKSFQKAGTVRTVGSHAASGGTQSFNVNGKVYNIPSDKVADFKKDFPNAK